MGLDFDVNGFIPKNLKPLLFSILSTSIFFYVVLYFSNRQWFDTAPVHIPILFSIVSSICWFIGNWFSNLVSILKAGHIDGKSPDYSFKVYLYSLVYLSIPTITSIYFSLTFIDFFLIASSIILTRFIIGIIFYVYAFFKK